MYDCGGFNNPFGPLEDGDKSGSNGFVCIMSIKKCCNWVGLDHLAGDVS